MRDTFQKNSTIIILISPETLPITMQLWHSSGPTYAPLAQLDRAFGFEPKGREFESLRAHFLFIIFLSYISL